MCYWQMQMFSWRGNGLQSVFYGKCYSSIGSIKPWCNTNSHKQDYFCRMLCIDRLYLTLIFYIFCYYNFWEPRASISNSKHDYISFSKFPSSLDVWFIWHKAKKSRWTLCAGEGAASRFTLTFITYLCQGGLHGHRATLDWNWIILTTVTAHPINRRKGEVRRESWRERGDGAVGTMRGRYHEDGGLRRKTWEVKRAGRHWSWGTKINICRICGEMWTNRTLIHWDWEVFAVVTDVWVIRSTGLCSRSLWTL